MMTHLTPRTAYSRAERLSDAAVHAAGVAAALCGVPVLIALTVLWRGDGMAVAGTAIYGVTLMAMILCSAIYHIMPHPNWKAVFRRLDHSAIYCKIAGTYSAFTLVSGQGLALLAAIWAAALCGTALKLHSPDRFRWGALALYLGMGWAGVVLGWPLFATMPGPVLALIALGGADLYPWRRLLSGGKLALPQHDLACLRPDREHPVLCRGDDPCRGNGDRIRGWDAGRPL